MEMANMPTESSGTSVGVGKLWPTGQVCPTACFCKVLLEHSHAPPSIHILAMAAVTIQWWNRVLARDWMAHEAKDIYHLVLDRKSLLSPTLCCQERVILFAPFPPKLYPACIRGPIIYLLNTYL